MSFATFTIALFVILGVGYLIGKARNRPRAADEHTEGV